MILAHWPMYALALAVLVWIFWSEWRSRRKKSASDAYIAALKKARERRALDAANRSLR